MKDENQTKAQLIDELAELRRRLTELEASESEHKRAEEEIRGSEERLSILFEFAPDAYYLSDLKGTFVDGNKAAEELVGYEKEELIGKNFLKLSLLSPGQVPKAVALLAKNALGQATGPDEFTLSRRDGSQVVAEIRTFPVKIKGEALVLGIARDITKRKQAEEELRIKDSAIASSINAIVIADPQGNLTYVNPSFLEMWGYDDDRKVLGRPAPEFWQQAGEAVEVMQSLHERGSWIGELVALRRDGSAFDAQLSANMVVNDEGGPICMMASFVDITERKRAEENTKRLAYYDTLTGLPNRTLFNDRLNQALAHAHRNRQKLGVMLLDLDGFKEVNDTLGHSVGDQLLKAVGERLITLLRKSDTVARMGGDEFLLILPQIARRESADKIAQKILEGLRETFAFNGYEFRITTSIGIAMYPDHGRDVDTLVRNADIAMYRAKANGRDNYQRYIQSE